MKLSPRQQANKNEYMRKKYAKDLIQPSENRFKLYYPKQHAKMEQDKEHQHLKKQREKKSKDIYFKQFKNSQHRYAMKRALQLEEKLEELNHG